MISVDVLKKIWEVVLLIGKISIPIGIIIAGVIASTSFFSSCQTTPKHDNYICEECYVATDCLYRMKAAKDATICAALVEACRDAMKESRYIKRMEYCKKSRPDGMTERECMLWLNSK